MKSFFSAFCLVLMIINGFLLGITMLAIKGDSLASGSSIHMTSEALFYLTMMVMFGLLHFVSGGEKCCKVCREGSA